MICSPLQWCHKWVMAYEITGNSTVCPNRLVRDYKKKSKLRINGSLWVESTGHRWIPLTKVLLYGKCIHVTSSSCAMVLQPMSMYKTLPNNPFGPVTWVMTLLEWEGSERWCFSVFLVILFEVPQPLKALSWRTSQLRQGVRFNIP